MRILGLSKKGIKEKNEDCYLLDNKCFYNESIDIDCCKCVFVFDGVGGGKDGLMASICARDYLCNKFDFITTASNEAIAQILMDINKNITTNIPNSGTTIAGIIINNTNLKVINIGDSKVYRIRMDIVKQLTHDDTYYQYLKNINDVNCDKYKNSHIITACLGMETLNNKNIHIKDIDFGIMEGDIFVICTDGVSDLVSEETILDICKKNNNISNIMSSLEKEVIDKGMHDNYTLIVLEV